MTEERAVAAVMRHISEDALREAVCGLVGIASPTGGEREAAAFLVERLARAGLDARSQELDERQANAVGVLAGGAGPSILLYAPIDTLTTGTAAEDVPWIGPLLRPDMLPEPRVTGDLVEGLGAGNPKGHAACVLVVAEALAASGIALPGEVVAGFGAGGMPTFAVPGAGVPGRENTGHGVGAAFLLQRGVMPDVAVIAKPGWNVSHEEVGLAWFDLVVPGVHTYVGSRHRLPYRNAIVVAAETVILLEEWLAAYPAAHELDTMTPQGVIASIRGGWERMAAVTSAEVRLRLDLRLTTAQTPAGVLRELREETARIGALVGAELRVEPVAAVPASRTDPCHPLVTAAVGAWERVAGVAHTPIPGNSGATDANVLRMHGLPTVRIGMPKVTDTPDGGEVDFARGMNLVDVREMRRLCEVLVRTVLAVS